MEVHKIFDSNKMTQGHILQ